MKRTNKSYTIIAVMLFIFFWGITNGTLAQIKQATKTPDACGADLKLSGVYRIDVDRSDRLFSVIEGVSSKVPYSEQPQFFMDLAVRLTPPDLLALKCRGGNRVSVASSRAARIDFLADGVTRSARNANGSVIRSRIAFERGSLIFTSSGGSDDNLNFTFTPLDDYRSLRVTRRISSKELFEPVVIQTVYEKISDVAKWDIFDDSQTVAQTANREIPNIKPSTTPRSLPVSGDNKAAILRAALNEWIEATNSLDIEKQMSFYMPELKAFYLARNASRNSVRLEKNRAFAAAKSIDIRAAEPEIVFQDNERTAIMRFRKKYSIENAANRRSGEVVQELRWKQTADGWKIFSERDVKVIR